MTDDGAKSSKRDWVGRTLKNRYVVERVLGAGGMGTVYLANDRDMGRKVVVKVPHARLLDDEEFRDRFSKEVRSLTQLSQAHIVRALDAGEAPDVGQDQPTPFAVLEYLDGGSLKDRLDRGTQTLAEVLHWLPDVAKALDFVHAEGVVHRDVKPGNVLFDRAGNAVLADFGIAKTLGAMDTGITRTGVTPGSPPYMGPEVGMGLPLTASYDQYALGVLVYESLSGALPHEGTSGEVLIARKAFIDPIDLHTKAPHVPVAARQAVMKAINRQPKERFASCAQFAAALADAAKGVAPGRHAPPPVVAQVTAPVGGGLRSSESLIEILEVREGHGPPRVAPPGGPPRPGPVPGNRQRAPADDAVEIVIDAADVRAGGPVRRSAPPERVQAPPREVSTSPDLWASTRMGPVGRPRELAAVLALVVATAGIYYLRWVYCLFREAHAYANRRREVEIPEPGPATAIFALTPLLIVFLAAAADFALHRAGALSDGAAIGVGLVALLVALPFAIAGWREIAGLVTKLRLASGVRAASAGNTARDALWPLLPGVGLLVYCGVVQARMNGYWRREAVAR